MIPNFSSLTALSNPTLAHLASLIGAAKSSPKAALVKRLQDELQIPRLPATGTRILSIDMGIRNLAYAVLEIPSLLLQKEDGKQIREPTSRPTISKWERLDLMPQQQSSSSTASSMEEDTLRSQNMEGSQKRSSTEKSPKQEFTPNTLFPPAHALLSRLLLSKPHTGKPEAAITTVLIEGQRFRSMGGASVLEWTLRVNMLEAMLWTILLTWKHAKLWQGDVWSMAPGRVGSYWEEQEARSRSYHGPDDEECTEETEARKKKPSDQKSSHKINGKEIKIATVEKWLRAGPDAPFKLEGTANTTAQQFMEKRSKIATRTRGGNVIGKLDDLADCLLQGMACLRWEETRRKAMTAKGWDCILKTLGEEARRKGRKM